MNRSCWRAVMMGAALLIGGSAPAHAQNQDRPAIDAEELQDRLSPETIDRLTQIARRAQQNGVPPRLIRQKVMEGVSKGVRGGRLVRAIEDYSRRLVEARNLLGRGARPEVLDAAAQAAEHGIPSSRIRSFAAANRDPRRAVVGLRTIGELRDAGVPTDNAVRAVQAALDRGVSGERLLALSAAVRRRVRQGESPTDALRAIAGGSRPGLQRPAPTRDRPGDRSGSDRPRTQPRSRGGPDRG
ncbi:MAG: hypothetical protein OEM96_02735 [Gemmatimonadota bacterium]|nr:hypothetical protein [Gemmatimonadota bacterium]